MPDITMCTGERCPLKQICYRHTATPSRYQSYFAKPPVLGGTCEYFWRAEVSKETDETKKKSKNKLTKKQIR
jgi:hypothetical protein